MTVRCPDGHQSATTDWCDQCGAPLEVEPAAGSAGSAGSAPPAGSAGSAAASPPDAGPGPAPGTPGQGADPALVRPSPDACPVCAEPRTGTRFCEACAYDFDTGVAAGAAPAVARRTAGAPAGGGTAVAPAGESGPAAAAPSAPSAPSVSAPPTGSRGQVGGSGEPPAGWVVEIAPDRAYFDRNTDDVAFPAYATPRLVVLTGTRTLVGRRSPSRGIHPDVDLSAAPEDRGVSRAHAFLDHPADGSISLTDLGSANGTWVDDDSDPVPAGRTVPLADGARVYVGSFTRVTVRRVSRSGADDRSPDS